MNAPVPEAKARGFRQSGHRPTLLAVLATLALAVLADRAIGQGQPSRDPWRDAERRAHPMNGRKDG